MSSNLSYFYYYIGIRPRTSSFFLARRPFAVVANANYEDFFKELKESLISKDNYDLIKLPIGPFIHLPDMKPPPDHRYH